jgi:predicted solute-binding protein
MNIRKIAMLRRQETKRERGLLRDCDGKLIIGQPKIKTRADLIRRMYANGYK